jgi:hypothetical protein
MVQTLRATGGFPCRILPFVAGASCQPGKSPSLLRTTAGDNELYIASTNHVYGEYIYNTLDLESWKFNPATGLLARHRTSLCPHRACHRRRESWHIPIQAFRSKKSFMWRGEAMLRIQYLYCSIEVLGFCQLNFWTAGVWHMPMKSRGLQLAHYTPPFL